MGADGQSVVAPEDVAAVLYSVIARVERILKHDRKVWTEEERTRGIGRPPMFYAIL